MIRFPRLGFALLLTALSSACAHVAREGRVEQATAYTLEDFARVPKFDAHVHVNAASEDFLDAARADGFELLSINVDYPDFPSLGDQEGAAFALAASNPRFHFTTTFSMDGFGAPGWADSVRTRIDAARAKGALAVKIWKNVGMSVRDAGGALVMIDDPLFDPILAWLEDARMPLIGHQGEPKNCWLPLAEMTTENDRSYFAEHPDYHMYLHPEMPSYEAQMAARDRMLDRHRSLSFVGAHLASLEWSVDELDAFLERFPDASVDLAARMTNLQHQSLADRAHVRAFFLKRQDRLIYGSDLTVAPDADPAEMRNEAHTTWLSDWKYLATEASQPVAALNAEIAGLRLPPEVIDKIYWRNARRVFFDGR